MTNGIDLSLLYHDPRVLAAIPASVQARRVLLGAVPTDPPEWQDNRLAEGRFFLWKDFVPDPAATYVGQLGARLDRKYARLELGWDNLAKRLAAAVGPKWVVAPWPAPPWWSDQTEHTHHGSKWVIDDLCRAAGLPMAYRRTVWAHDFVCEQSVWLDFRKTFRKVLRYFAHKYRSPMGVPFPAVNCDGDRVPAYLYERVTCLYFANRTDLEVVQL